MVGLVNIMETAAARAVARHQPKSNRTFEGGWLSGTLGYRTVSRWRFGQLL
jgi:hypothetical protein